MLTLRQAVGILGVLVFAWCGGYFFDPWKLIFKVVSSARERKQNGVVEPGYGSGRRRFKTDLRTRAVAKETKVGETGAVQINLKLDQAKNISINKTLPVDSHDTPRALEADGTLRPIGKHTRKQRRKKEEEDRFSFEETTQKYEHTFGSSPMANAQHVYTLGTSPQAKVQHVSKQTCAEKAESQNAKVLEGEATFSSDVQECGMSNADEKSILFLTQQGNTAPETKLAFDEVVEKLLENKKLAGETKTKKDLNVLALCDGCMLYESFWNPDHVFAKDELAITSDKLTDPSDQIEKLHQERLKKRELVRDLVKETGGSDPGKGTGVLNQWYCLDERKAKDGFGDVDGQRTGGFGSFEAISISDRMMTPEEFGVLLKIRAEKLSKIEVDEAISSWRDFADREVPEDIKKLIEDADIIVSGDGEHDVIAFVWRYFKQVAMLVRDKIRAGNAIFWGRNAGSDVASADFHLTWDMPAANIAQMLLVENGGYAGLELTPRCAVSQKFRNGWKGWQDAFLPIFEESSGLHVVSISSGAALQCFDGCCVLVNGRTGKPQILPHQQRILRAFSKKSLLMRNIQEVIADAIHKLDEYASEEDQRISEQNFEEEQNERERQAEKKEEEAHHEFIAQHKADAVAATSKNEANGEEKKDNSLLPNLFSVARNSLPPNLILGASLALGVHVSF